MKASGARFYGYLPHSELSLFYSAADIYLLPAFSPDYSGGIGVATLEAFACGIPVVSPVIRDYPIAELEKLGNIPKNEKDVTRCVSEILENPDSYKDCRQVAMRYFDWKIIIDRTIEVYDQLFEKYY